MTTKIDCVSFVRPERSTLSISPSDAKKLLDKYDDGSLPENCFLRDVEDKIGSQTKEKVKCQCGTQSYGNAKFCRECGTKLPKKSIGGIEIMNLDWHDDDYDATAANTFFPVFVDKVVPVLQGHAEGCVTYSEDDEDADMHTAHFVIDDGTITWCEIQLVPGADAPSFDAEDLYEESDDEDEEDEEEDEDEDEDNDRY